MEILKSIDWNIDFGNLNQIALYVGYVAIAMFALCLLGIVINLFIKN